MALYGQLEFQNGMSPLMEQLILFHDHAMMVLMMISSLVGYILFSLLTGSFICRYLLEGQQTEIIWTVAPAAVLIFLALPSLRLLYLLDEINNPAITIKTMGHQWYWSYEYSDFIDVEFDSYMAPSEELKMGEFRLLEVDHRLVIPMESSIRMLISAADVIHAWALPTLGVKLDAIPGRLNQTSFTTTKPGLFYGQCSEICGANHSFMPIVLESVNTNTFINWVKSL